MKKNSEEYETEMNLWLKYFHVLMQIRVLLLRAMDIKRQIQEQEGKNTWRN
ncbi:MAG: hypothetical protein UZ01_02565 [Candidatus Brocadia sinica]|nr:MAG: hypothetical protein UZ01_02565 [Candidatus Brocadia sinica]